MEDKIVLGSTVEDRVTGFRGVAVGRFEPLTGSVRYHVAPEIGPDGRYREEWFDEQRLMVLKNPVLKLS